MTAEKLAREVAHWVRDYDFCGKVDMSRVGDHYHVRFSTRTTATRSSSMVTRVRLIVSDIEGISKCKVGKVLISSPPKKRGDLATWSIYVRIPIKCFKCYALPGNMSYALEERNALS